MSPRADSPEQAGRARACHDPYLRCAFYGAAQTAVGVKHACILAHSPQGCELLVRTAFGWQQADYIETKSLCTKLCEDEIVHGGEETLARTIEEARAFSVPVVFVLTACGPEIVGDNIRAVCEEMSSEVPFRLVPIECAGYRGSQYDGVDIALDTILREVGGVNDRAAEAPAAGGANDRAAEAPAAGGANDRAAGAPAAGGANDRAAGAPATGATDPAAGGLDAAAGGRIPGSVVLVAPHGNGNPSWPGDLAWTKATLERMGLRVLVSLTHRTPLEDIPLARRAEWSLLLSHDCGFRAVDYLDEAHGVKPLLPGVPLPIGFTGTTRWVRALGQAVGREREASAVVEEGEKLVVEQCRRNGLELQFFNGARVAILTDATLGLPLLRVAVEDLEMQPVALGLRSKNPRMLEMVEREARELGLTVKEGADRPGGAPSAAGKPCRVATEPDPTATETPPSPSALHLYPDLDVYQAKRILATLGPDAVLASNIERHLSSEVGIQYCFRIMNPVSRFRLTDRAYFGYAGFLNLLEIIQNDWWDAFRSRKKRWEAKW